MPSWIRLVAASSLIALASPAAADMMADMAFQRLDSNGDGRLDAAELREARINRFERMDANGDGIVTHAEQMAAAQRMRRNAQAVEGAMTARFEALDVNGDSRLTLEEFLASPGGGLAARFDTDGDGSVSKAEFTAAIEAARAAR